MLVKQIENSGYVVYFVDETAAMNLKHDFERTIDLLHAQNESVEKILADERKYSEQIVRNAVVPTIVVSDEQILIASESAKKIFRVYENQQLAEFISLNDISATSTSEQTFEATASGGKIFVVSRWESEPIPSETSEQRQTAWFYTYNDVTELKRVEAELHKMTAESGQLFNSLLPTARVKNEKFVEWNDSLRKFIQELSRIGQKSRCVSAIFRRISRGLQIRTAFAEYDYANLPYHRPKVLEYECGTYGRFYINIYRRCY